MGENVSTTEIQHTQGITCYAHRALPSGISNSPSVLERYGRAFVGRQSKIVVTRNCGAVARIQWKSELLQLKDPPAQLL